jgi:hypothetical protein
MWLPLTATDNLFDSWTPAMVEGITFLFCILLFVGKAG